jgi:hypothetical protein
MSRMTYMRSLKSHRLASHTWLGLNPQIGRPLSRIFGAIGLFLRKNILFGCQKGKNKPSGYKHGF